MLSKDSGALNMNDLVSVQLLVGVLLIIVRKQIFGVHHLHEVLDQLLALSLDDTRIVTVGCGGFELFEGLEIVWRQGHLRFSFEGTGKS